ncbi:hypothetical protein [Streptomyces sp. SID3343]|uniref:hypothetical protein n=1 Tax=Streptomyces sp. SID3343 TaxID=2690260 RepID=UPI001370B083|nr:hypothetical protein [Streptomyces sp. SID3343]MYV98145.1 hypothetical protein [Streptomyces sp. SID3343]
MAHTIRRTGTATGPVGTPGATAVGTHRPRLSLNSDGRAHPRENTLVAVTVLFALVAGICVFFRDMHILGAWTALGGVVTGLISQMFSATTGERAVTILALGVSAVSLFMNMFHGGLY